jgi:hydroxylaminobenzene mutase
MSRSKSLAARRLVQLGVILFLIGLLVGFSVPALANPRMGLSSHMEGVMNGLFLLGVGLLWPQLALSDTMLTAAYWLAIFGTFTNVVATFLSAMWGAGLRMMPIAAQGQGGSDLQETVIQVLLVALSLAMVAVCAILAYGLRGAGDTSVRTA